MLPLADICLAAAASCPHFCDAVAMLRVWARQQQQSQGADGLSGTLLTMLLVQLLETGQAVRQQQHMLSIVAGVHAGACLLLHPYPLHAACYLPMHGPARLPACLPCTWGGGLG